MRQGPLVFLDIDTQRDFLEPDGSLYIVGSERILPNLARLTSFAREQGIPVLATACAHTLDETDPEPFPPHCLVGTRGQERVEATARPDGVVLGPDEHFEGKTLPPYLTLQKQGYDLFTHPDADRIVQLYSQNDPTFVVYGVATDYCVKCAVLGLRERRKEVVVVVDAVRAVEPDAEPALLAEFVRWGAALTTTSSICVKPEDFTPETPEKKQ